MTHVHDPTHTASSGEPVRRSRARPRSSCSHWLPDGEAGRRAAPRPGAGLDRPPTRPTLRSVAWTTSSRATSTSLDRIREPLGEPTTRIRRVDLVEAAHRRAPGWEESSWPRAMTPDENRADLQRHADDLRPRTGFTYTVLNWRASRDRVSIRCPTATTTPVRSPGYGRATRSSTPRSGAP